ncbi:hypothetical protein B0H14DRAFT_3782399 [Mycena olivaceomarginata]|nr:hypothetical protein B0H14DRAFT_3675574 [Mycena olivaceomarginata]KAJ7801846.1 hypothetical protein B0H14DRAFT_3782399 [Mycena olivaceomarginata]
MPGLRSQTQVQLARLSPATDPATRLEAVWIQSYQIALAPHKKLPPEVLAIIFVNCVGTPIILPPSPKEPALALAGTCRSWRQIILSIPNLWNNIFLDFRGPKPVKLLEFAKLWISRSENTLISIRNSSSRWTENRLIAENVDPITYLVAPYVTRCREVDLRFLESSIDEFFTLPAGSIERLEVLYLETLGFTMPFCHTSDEPLDVFRSAPCLRRVLFSTDLCSLDPQVLGLPGASSLVCTSSPPTSPRSRCTPSSARATPSSNALLRHPDRRPPRLRPRAPPRLRPPRPPLPHGRVLPPNHRLRAFLRPLVLPALTDLELRPLEAGLLPQCPWSQACVPRPPRALALRAPPPRILHYTLPRGPRRDPARHAVPHAVPPVPWAGARAAPPAEWDAGVLRALGRGALLPALEELTFSTYPLAGVLEALEARVAAGRGTAGSGNGRAEEWDRASSAEHGAGGAARRPARRDGAVHASGGRGGPVHGVYAHARVCARPTTAQMWRPDRSDFLCRDDLLYKHQLMES